MHYRIPDFTACCRSKGLTNGACANITGFWLTAAKEPHPPSRAPNKLRLASQPGRSHLGTSFLPNHTPPPGSFSAHFPQRKTTPRAHSAGKQHFVPLWQQAVILLGDPGSQPRHLPLAVGLVCRYSGTHTPASESSARRPASPASTQLSPALAPAWAALWPLRLKAILTPRLQQSFHEPQLSLTIQAIVRASRSSNVRVSVCRAGREETRKSTALAHNLADLPPSPFNLSPLVPNTPPARCALEPHSCKGEPSHTPLTLPTSVQFTVPRSINRSRDPFRSSFFQA